MKRFRIDYSFYLILICFLFSPYQLVFLQFILLIVLHELGHIFFLFLFKIDIISLRLCALGFLMEIDETKEKWFSEFLIASGGVMFNAFSLLFLSGNLRNYSLLIITINLLPIAPLDGNRILRCLISFVLPYKLSLYFESLLNFCFLVLLSYLLIRNFDYLFLFTYFYLWIVGISKYKQIKYKYSAFTLNRYLYPPTLPKRRVKFRENNSELLYRYQIIYSKLNEVRVSEKDFLKLKYG